MKNALVTLSAFALIIAAAALPVYAAGPDAPTSLSVRITSPMGRTGEPGTVRIVAQVRASPGIPLQAVQFWVDGNLLATVSNPPFATNWDDVNPFNPNEIKVEATDSLGNRATDSVTLKPFEITEISEVTRVLVDASVQDKSGRFVRALSSHDFEV